MRVVVLSDTHSPRFWKGCPPDVARHLEGAELILHAGDVCTADVLDELARVRPGPGGAGQQRRAGRGGLGSTGNARSWTWTGWRWAMIHDSGPAAGRVARLRRRFPAADLVVFGHSHIPMDVAESGLRIFNPGSPTDKRRQPYRTLGLLRIESGALVERRIVELP